MVQQFENPERSSSNVVPISASACGSAATELEEVFRRKRDVLVQYLGFRLGNGFDAHDIAQAAFLRLWERREQLRQDNLEALLFVTARNIANDLLRGRVRRADWAVEVTNDPDRDMDTVSAPDRIIAARQDLAVISDLLRELPDKCRHAFVRYKFDGQEYREIASEMRICGQCSWTRRDRRQITTAFPAGEKTALAYRPADRGG